MVGSSWMCEFAMGALTLVRTHFICVRRIRWHKTNNEMPFGMPLQQATVDDNPVRWWPRPHKLKAERVSYCPATDARSSGQRVVLLMPQAQT